MVLNGDSTHPKPWRPATDWEATIRTYHAYKIYDPNRPMKFKPRPNWVRDEPLKNNLWWAFKKGLPLGLIFATIDVNVVSKLNHPRALVARYVYFTVPTVGIFMSYFSMQAVARDLAKKLDWPDDGWFPHWAAAFGPASIIGAWKGSWKFGYLHFAFIGLFSKMYTEMCKSGLFMEPPEKELTAAAQSYTADGWASKGRGWSWYDYWDRKGPSWTKWAEDKRDPRG